MSSVRVPSPLHVHEQTVFGILDQEAKVAVTEARNIGLSSVVGEAPIGLTGLLAREHTMRVGRSAHGYQARLRRGSDAWYGTVVEKGRKAGRSKRGRRRRVSAAKANPYVDRAAVQIEDVAEKTLEAGADRVAARISERL